MIIKKLIITFSIMLSFSITCYSQLLIGKNTFTGSVLIDFAENTTNGLILPHVEDVTTMTNVTEGTLVFDKATKKVQYYDGVNWVAINQEEGVLASLEEELEIGGDQGVILGSDESTAKGVLILESSDKAMVLPKIHDPAKNVTSPYPGMMCYDTKGGHVYFFNGLTWEVIG